MGILDSIQGGFNKSVDSAGRATKKIQLNAQVSEIDKQRDRLLAQLGASLFAETCADPHFREPREQVYAEIEALDTRKAGVQEELAQLEQAAALAAAARTTIVCQNCGRSLQATSTFCTGCGTAVAAIPPVAGAGGVLPANAIPCAACGAPLPPDTRFCTSCGAAVTAPPEVPPVAGADAVLPAGTLPCATCGAPLTPDTRFCTGCGSPVAGA